MDAMSYLMKSEFRKESQFRFHGESYMEMCAEVIMNKITFFLLGKVGKKSLYKNIVTTAGKKLMFLQG